MVTDDPVSVTDMFTVGLRPEKESRFLGLVYLMKTNKN